MLKIKIGFLVVVGILLTACSSLTNVGNTTEVLATDVPVEPTSMVDAAAILPPVTQTGTFMDKPAIEHLRVLNFNVNWDSIFPDDDPKNHDFRDFDKSEAFVRIVNAVQPDVLCLQELNSTRRLEEFAKFMHDVLPIEGEWYVTLARDTVIYSRYPLLVKGYTLATTGQAAALIDLPDAVYGETDFYLMCSHFKSGGGQSDIIRRGDQADELISHIRDFETEGDRLDLPENTPFAIMGDFNAYDTDPAYHIVTLMTGDIIYEKSFGADYSPDWDGTDLTDLLPTHNGLGQETYTWRESSGGFNPGALDRIFYADSVMSVSNSFVLNTMSLSVDELTLFGLEADDVVLDAGTGYYDHLPMVVDFILGD